MSGALGKYKVEARLGGGGMAEVFVGSVVGAEGFARRVAIKRVLPGYSNNPTFAQMFVAEAQLSARLAHPNVVSVLDFDRDAEQRLFLVMELVEGRDLHALNATGLLPFPVVIHIIAEVLRGLGYAHDAQLGGAVKGVVHRDISPHNILLSWEGDVKVSDFGLAKARDASQATATDFVKGKPAYMSPEQANGQPLDGRSDLFAVGVMLWEMLTGKRLFSAEDTRATLAAVLFGKIPRPRQFRPEVPKDLERVVMKLLEREVSARYRNAGDAADDLSRCSIRGATRETLAAMLRDRFSSTPSSTPALEAVSVAPRPSRGRWGYGLLVGGFVVAGAISGMALGRTGRAESTAVQPRMETDPAPKPSVAEWFHADDVTTAARPLPDAGNPQLDAPMPLAFDPSFVPPKCVAFIAALEKVAKCSRAAAERLAEYKQAITSHKADERDMFEIEQQCQLSYSNLRHDSIQCGDGAPVDGGGQQ